MERKRLVDAALLKATSRGSARFRALRCNPPAPSREGCEQAARNAGPAPAFDDRGTCGPTQRRPVLRGQAKQLREPLREIGGVPRVEGGERAELGRICRLQAGGDLGQPRMPCYERRA